MYKRIFKKHIKLKDNHNIEISRDMPKDDLIDALFMASEDEDTLQFKRGWSQLDHHNKMYFIRQFKKKYTHDTHDKMYFVLETIV